MTQYAPVVVDAGSPSGYIVFRVRDITIDVRSGSAATIAERAVSPYRFASATDRAHWRRHGSPDWVARRTPPSTTRLGAGRFSYVPLEGRPLTLADVRRLPGEAGAIERVIASHLGDARPVSADVMLQAEGFLLGWAPLSSAARRALVSALRRTAGGRRCGTGRDPHGGRADLYCATGPDQRTLVLLSRRRSRVLRVQERLARPSRWYPGLPRGRLIESDAFGP
jgi:hypothetical protein